MYADSTTPSYADLGGAGKEGPALLFLSFPLAAARVGLAGSTAVALALAGPAGDLKNALLRRRLRCYEPDCA